MWVIVKNVKYDSGKILPVILIDSENEILEFKNYEDAEKLKNLFELNSDSGHKYEVKKIK